jgi:hypothetical protein
MGGPLERALRDDELTMQDQRPGSREYLCTHLLLEGGYKIKFEEIRCKSVQSRKLAQNMFQWPVRVNPFSKILIIRNIQEISYIFERLKATRKSELRS